MRILSSIFILYLVVISVEKISQYIAPHGRHLTAGILESYVRRNLLLKLALVRIMFPES